MSSSPHIAPSVRLAMPVESAQIAEVQRRVWQANPQQAPLLEDVDVAQMTQIWHSAIVAPPMAHYRVMVATEPWGPPLPAEEADQTRLATKVFGFSAVGPCEDADADLKDGEILEFCIDPPARGRGHGSRLLNASVDTLAADGYERAVWWISSTDDDLRRFLTTSGWAADGAHRELGSEDGEIRIKQVRLHTDISDLPAAE